MRAIRVSAISAALFVSTAIAAQGSGAVVPKRHVNATKPAKTPAKAPAASAPIDSGTKVNEFMSYDPAAKTVALVLDAAHGSVNGGMNFNGASNGGSTITIPVGWTVSWQFKNEDAIPHSAIVLANKMPFPAQPQDPAIPRAYTNDVTGGLPTNGTDRTTFKAATAGQYVIACGVPGHAPSGMWINFVVSADAKAPTYTTK
ncbi:MAG TPA: sulfocyanin-like copper-binding protein [Gemmatimonadaceae bacterium]|jgi:sulfocyanin|nr:sulfocyanin-like copper-binding protein [Gemmatimonadaceae bacterium]